MIYQIYGSDTLSMTRELMDAAGIAAQIPAGARVALKPNLVVAGKPERGATTHSGVLAGCVEYLQDHGIADIRIIEGSWIGDNTGRAFRCCGYDEVCQRYGIPFFDLKRDHTRSVATPLRSMELCAQALDADYLINLPVLKGHCQTRMTCALKNLKGCLPDREKRRFHTEGLHRPIAALAAALKPELTIVDNICGDLDFEEGGNPVQTNRMFLGNDPVQIDAYGCRLMGIELSDVPYIQLAERWGVGSNVVDESEIVCLNTPDRSVTDTAPTGAAARLSRNVRQNSACSACYAGLIRALYELDREGIPPRRELFIGQGWRGRKVPGIGVGNCCAGAGQFVPGCPVTAQAAAEFLRRL